MGALPVHHTATVDTPWDKSAVKADNEAGYRYCYAWVDSSADADLRGPTPFLITSTRVEQRTFRGVATP